MDALILAGGRGTRLASVVSDRAKPVAPVGGKPFLHHVLEQLALAPGVDRAILCIGHHAQSVRDAVGLRFGDLEIAYSPEDTPLGTGGAIAQALRAHDVSGTTLAINGDSFFGQRPATFLAFHRERRAFASLAAARIPDASRYGALELDDDRVTGFREKGRSGPAWINAGWYLLGPKAVAELKDRRGAFSLETQALARWADAGKLRAHRSRARFIDIGTPGDYARAARVVSGPSRGIISASPAPLTQKDQADP